MLSFFFKKWKQTQGWIKSTISFKRTDHFFVLKNDQEEHFYRILCVDDDQNYCRFIKKVARSLGIQLDLAHSIEEAKKQIESHTRYHAFIIDGHFPKGSGFQLVSWIREKIPFKVPIGFISRIYHDAKSFRFLKENLGVDYVLDKPINTFQIRQLLVKLCQLNDELSKIESFAIESFADEIFENLKENYQKTIPDKIERLEKLILNIQKDPTKDNLQTLRGEVHKIAGSAGCYGFDYVSELCKNLEKDLISQLKLSLHGRVDRQWVYSLDDFFAQIKHYFQMEHAELDTQQNFPFPFVYIVDNDPLFSKKAKNNLFFEIVTTTNPEEALKNISFLNRAPEILLLNFHYENSSLTAYDIMKSFYQKNEDLLPKVGILLEAEAVEDQIEALKTGMSTVLTKPISMEFSLNLLDQIPFHPLPIPCKILIIEEDQDIIDYITETLKFPELEFMLLENIQSLGKTIQTMNPDIILLDLEFTEGKGTEVLFFIREELKYSNSIIGMSTKGYENRSIDDEKIDEILFKPLARELLLIKVSSLIKKQIKKKCGFKKDTATELENRKTLVLYLEELLNRASHLPIYLAMFKVEGVTLSQKIKKDILHEITSSLDDLLKKHELAVSLEDGYFACVFRGFDPTFIQLFMENFLKELHTKLSKKFKQDLYIQEILKSFSNSKTVDEMILECQKSLEAGPTRGKKIINLKSDKGIELTRSVIIFHDEIDQDHSLRQFFEERQWIVTTVTNLEKNFISQISPLPLIILKDSWVSKKGLKILQKLHNQNKIQFPILYFSHPARIDHLEKVFNEIRYFESPFGMVIFLGRQIKKEK